MPVTGTPLVSVGVLLGALTVRVAAAEWVVAPDVPVIESAAAPVVVVAVVVMVSVDEPPAVTLAGLNAPVAPEGRPVTESATLWVLPLTAVVETVNVAEAPCTTVADDGETATV
jgi:hypothetical protein